MFWLDGTASSTSRLPFDVADRGFLLGDGVFDTSLVLRGKMVWQDAHVERLLKFCQVLGFAAERARIEAAIAAVITPNFSGSLRLTVTRGAGPRGIAPPREPRPSVLAATSPLRAEALFAPIRLHVTGIRRNETSPVASVKSLAYVDAVLAMREAMAAAFDDVLFLNSRGHVACTATGNIFALSGNELLTPPLTEGVVPGIVRGAVIDASEAIGLESIERPLQLGDLDRADALFVTSSLRLVAPVSALRQRGFDSPSSRRVEALIAEIARQIRDVAGIDPRRLATD